MSSRLTRALLKLYPRRIRDRYGDELLDLQDELRAQDDVSRTRVIGDMLAGALLVQPARRAYLLIGAVLVIGGLAVAEARIGGPGADSPARASHLQARLMARSAVTAPPTCLVADGSSCSLTPCTEFTARSSSEGGGVADELPVPYRRALRLDVRVRNTTPSIETPFPPRKPGPCLRARIVQRA
jgi:hypothetical protein